jgi:hypothetical protein
MHMVMIKPEDLAELRERNRTSAAELAADLERRELEDPVLDVPVMREASVTIVHKTTMNGSAYAEPAAQASLSNDELIDDLAHLLAETRTEIRREFETRIAVLEARIDTLLTVLAGTDSTRARSVRKRLQNGQQLIEDQRTRS